MKVLILSDFSVDEIDGKICKVSYQSGDKPVLTKSFGQLLVDKGLAEEIVDTPKKEPKPASFVQTLTGKNRRKNPDD